MNYNDIDKAFRTHKIPAWSTKMSTVVKQIYSYGHNSFCTKNLMLMMQIKIVIKMHVYLLLRQLIKNLSIVLMGIVLKLMRIHLGWGWEIELRFVASFAAGGLWVYNHGQHISGKLKFFCETAPYGKSSISIFQEFFASIGKILILGARLSTRL